MSVKAWSAGLRSIAAQFRNAVADPPSISRIQRGIPESGVVGESGLYAAGHEPFRTARFELASEMEREAFARVDAQALSFDRSPVFDDPNAPLHLVRVNERPIASRLWHTPGKGFQAATCAALTLLLNPPECVLASELADILPIAIAGSRFERSGEVSDSDYAAALADWRSAGCPIAFAKAFGRGVVFCRFLNCTKPEDFHDWLIFLHRLAWRRLPGLPFSATLWRVTADGRVKQTTAPAELREPVAGSFFQPTDQFSLLAGRDDSELTFHQRLIAALASDDFYSWLGGDTPIDVSIASGLACDWLAAFAEDLATLPAPNRPVRSRVTPAPLFALSPDQRIDLAVGALRRDPNRKAADIAREVGINAGSLSRSRVWQLAKQATMGEPLPRGRRHRDGAIEADTDAEF